jgi:hypothetical protein
VIGKKIVKLLSAGFIREVFHPEWLANPVLVKKKNKKWRMCVDCEDYVWFEDWWMVAF